MKKQLLLIVILLLKIVLLNAQVVNNLNKRAYDQSKVLFFPAVGKGISILEMDDEQRQGLPPTPSFVIFNTSSNSFEYFNGFYWLSFNPYQVNQPTVSTTNVSEITSTTAISGGTIQNEGGSADGARGVCWSIHTNPTIADSITLDGTGAGNFASHMKGLLGNTTYFLRAYVKVNNETIYGNEVTFKTPPFRLLCVYGVDTVTLKTEGYGSNKSIEWQESRDSVNWTTIPGAVNNPYRMVPSQNQYYRAMIASSPTTIQWVKQEALLKYTPVPKNLTTGNTAVIQDFGSLAGWVLSDGNGSMELDTANQIQGENSLKIITDASTSTSIKKAGPFDLSSFQTIRLWYYLPDIASVSAVTFQLLQSNDAKFISFQGIPYKQGWNSFEIQRSGFRNINGADWNAPFDNMKITLKPKGTGTARASVYRMEGITADTQPAVIINFDDGYESVYTNAYPIMKARKIRATCYIVTSYVGQQQMITWDECRALNEAGWDMGSHTNTHANLTLLSAAEIDKEINTCRDLMIAHGLEKAVNFMAYPYGSNNDLVVARMAANHMTLGRCVINHYLTCPPNFRYTLETRNISSTTTLADAKKIIDDAIAGGNIISLLFHNIVETPVASTDWSITDFKELMDYIVLKQIQPLTITQYNDLITKGTYVYKLPAN